MRKARVAITLTGFGLWGLIYALAASGELAKPHRAAMLWIGEAAVVFAFTVALWLRDLARYRVLSHSKVNGIRKKIVRGYMRRTAIRTLFGAMMIVIGVLSFYPQHGTLTLTLLYGLPITVLWQAAFDYIDRIEFNRLTVRDLEG